MPSKPKLLVLGTGWGGTSLLRALRKASKYDITVASVRDHMLFTPLLTSTATGALEHRSIIEPIRPLATKRQARFLKAQATQIESRSSSVLFEVPRLVLGTPASTSVSSTLQTDAGSTWTFREEYDGLVVAVGATVNTFGVNGVEQHALFMKEAHDARMVRKRMNDAFEAAALPVASEHERQSLLTFVVCGAGPTGVELTAEMADWLRDMGRSRRYGALVDLARVVLVEASGNILSAFDHSLRTYALSRLRAARVEVKLGATVRRVEAGAVELDDSSAKDMDVDAPPRERLPCGMVVWTAGIAPRPVIAASDVPKTTAGSHVETDAFLLCENTSPNAAPIFAIGDCARVRDNPLVPIAQVAEQQGIYVADLLNKADRLDADALRAVGKPFAFASRGMLAYVGSARGVAAVATATGNTDSQKQNMVRSSGFFAWLIWRFAYFSKLGSFRNKLQVPIDWVKTAFFGRDVSSF